MKVVKVTEQDGYVEYHVDQKLRKDANLNPAGIRVARVIELSGISARDYSYISSESFTIKTTKAGRGTFIGLVSQYGDKTPTLQMSWGKVGGYMRLKVETNTAFSARDVGMLKLPVGLSAPPRIGTIHRLSTMPTKSIALDCLHDVDRPAVERFVREILG